MRSTIAEELGMAKVSNVMNPTFIRDSKHSRSKLTKSIKSKTSNNRPVQSFKSNSNHMKSDTNESAKFAAQDPEAFAYDPK